VTEVEIFEDLLVLYSRDAKGVSLAVGLARVTGVEEDPEVARTGLGTFEFLDFSYRGGVTRATSSSRGGIAFFNMHDPEKHAVICLRNERYTRLVIGVEDPSTSVATIWEAIGGATDHA
jgi:hypothetical protein